GPRQPLWIAQQQMVQRAAPELLHDDEGTLAAPIELETVATHDVPMMQTDRHGEFTMQQRIAVGVLGELIAQGFQRHEGSGIPTLRAEHIAPSIDRAHAADAQLALDLGASTKHIEQRLERLARLRLARRSRFGKGEIGLVRSQHLLAHISSSPTNHYRAEVVPRGALQRLVE